MFQQILRSQVKQSVAPRVLVCTCWRARLGSGCRRLLRIRRTLWRPHNDLAVRAPRVQLLPRRAAVFKH